MSFKQESIFKEQVAWVFDATLDPHFWGDFPFWHEAGAHRFVFLDHEPPEIPGWELEDVLMSTGERECPHQADSKKVTRKQAILTPRSGRGKYALCPLCEARVGMAHGTIYIGEGWRKAIYRKEY
jgi:hypothetical protein